MNKKVLFIGGGILLLGGIAYLYFSKKKKTEALLSGAVAPSVEVDSETTNNIPPLSTGGITPLVKDTNTIQEQQNLDKANDIVELIKKYERYNSLRKKNVSFPSSITTFSFASNPYPTLISKLKNDLLKLGYEYKGTTDGVLVKL